MKLYVMSVDLGSQQDYTATSVIEYVEILDNKKTLPGGIVRKFEDYHVSFEHHLKYLSRESLGTSYPDIIRTTGTRLKNPELESFTELIVDVTGVGLPVLQQMKEQKMDPVGIMITGGHEVGLLHSPKGESLGYKVPKRDIVTALQIAFQSRRLRIPAGLPYINEFVEELKNFRHKTTKAGNDTYEAWRDSIHDDLVLSVGMAVWYLEMKYGLGKKVLASQNYENEKEYDPFADM